MDVSSVGSAQSPANAAQVTVFKKASQQQEAVVGTILKGVEEGAQRLPSQTGQSLNIAA